MEVNHIKIKFFCKNNFINYYESNFYKINIYFKKKNN